MVSPLKHKCATGALLPRVAPARRSSPLSSAVLFKGEARRRAMNFAGPLLGNAEHD
jgi:hypothetical protein